MTNPGFSFGSMRNDVSGGGGAVRDANTVAWLLNKTAPYLLWDKHSRTRKGVVRSER